MKKQALEDRSRSLGETVTSGIRRLLVEGAFAPGQQLSEMALCERLGVSRNTLREAFRTLAHEGLVTHQPHRGVFVTRPGPGSIVEIYRLRRFIECRALSEAWPSHPAVKEMRAAVENARERREQKDWLAVGTANMAFHGAIVALADSPRLDAFFSQILAELRLAFGLMADKEWLHGPYVEMNQQVLDTFEGGDTKAAVALLEQYLAQSERVVLAAWERQVASGG
ncbi:GntR family transcriptional regulator [Kushneria indalinina]|uniref:GntR family transcriptional regulator n=1 Tax=Kushneria indalinina DSM 14324 TaxID=1122140 RepID=A0A3D9DSP8_9GAMM|nr:GntR family transcriptional regulator [Kushneria indalinina]REC93800.1 GntR family transcriptional regulator [Kushneria indalinina DSM 14324]